MSAVVFGFSGAVAIGLGLYGLIINPQPLRRILAFNVLGAGAFVLYGVVARRGAAAGFSADPVPQAFVITGMVVAFAATALGSLKAGEAVTDLAAMLNERQAGVREAAASALRELGPAARKAASPGARPQCSA